MRQPESRRGAKLTCRGDRLTCAPARPERPTATVAKVLAHGRSSDRQREESMKSLKAILFGAALLASSGVMTLVAAQGRNRRRLLVQLPGRAVETDEAAIKGALAETGQIHFGGRSGVADQTTHRRREPYRKGRERPDNPRDGRGRDPSGGQEGGRRSIPVIAYDRQIESPRCSI